MLGIDHWPIEVKNMDGEEFLIYSRDCSWRPKDRFPLNDHRVLSTLLYTLPPWELDKVQDLVLSIDRAKISVHWNRRYVKRPDIFRMKEALDAGEILVYLSTDPDEAALKALRQQIQLLLTEILSQERAEAARLEAEHSNRKLLEKVGAYAETGVRGLGEAGLSFLTWLKNIHDVLSIHERQRRMMWAAWEAHNLATDGDWVETFKNRLIAAEHKEVVEALGFDPLKVDREMLAKAYEIANLVWEDEKTQAMLVRFAEDYARAQHSLEWTNIAGGAAFEIILTVVLAAFTGGLGVASLFGSKARLLTPLKKLGGLFEELAKLRRRVKLHGDGRKGGAPVKDSRLEYYVTDEKVPEPSPPPKGSKDEAESKKLKIDPKKRKLLEQADKAYANAIKARNNYIKEVKKSTKNRALLKQAEGRTVASNGFVTRSAFASKVEPFEDIDRKEIVDFWNNKTSDRYSLPLAGGQDKGVPGSYFAGHAEKQMVMLHDKQGLHSPMGISREQCGDCRVAIQDFAETNNVTIVAKDPEFSRIYNADGSVEIYQSIRGNDGEPDYLLVKLAEPGEAPTATTSPSSYKGNPW